MKQPPPPSVPKKKIQYGYEINYLPETWYQLITEVTLIP